MREIKGHTQSAVVYTVYNFWFEEQGAVVGFTDDFINHSRVRGSQSVTGTGLDREKEAREWSRSVHTDIVVREMKQQQKAARLL